MWLLKAWNSSCSKASMFLRKYLKKSEVKEDPLLQMPVNSETASANKAVTKVLFRNSRSVGSKRRGSYIITTKRLMQGWDSCCLTWPQNCCAEVF